jgi:hypothetical protein
MRHRSKVAWVVLVCGVVFAASNAYDIVRVVVSGRWPIVTGIITALSERPDRVVAPKPLGYHSVPPSLYVRYDYTVRGGKYEGSRLSFAAPPTTQRALDTYSVGSVVAVHYDPVDPSSAVLATSVPADRIIELLLALLLVGYSAYIAFWRRRLREPASPAENLPAN